MSIRKPTKRPGSPYQLVLVGGGHAHLFVLQAILNKELVCHEVTLISPSRWQYYSGMLPGLIAGHYQKEQCRIDLRGLAQKAGIRFIEQTLVSLDVEQRSIVLDDDTEVGYEWLSLDTGSATCLDWAREYQGQLLSVKPLDRFAREWQGLKDRLKQNGGGQVAVVGAGAAGVELALAASSALADEGIAAKVSLVAGESGPLEGFSGGVRRRVLKELKRLNIQLLSSQAKAEGDQLRLSDGSTTRVDAVIAASGACAPDWLAGAGLELAADGFIRVDARQQSVSHKNVFAVGDVCSRPGSPLMRSGVHSVRAGPVLAQNLAASLSGKRLKRFRPRRWVLYLISCGQKRAVGSWGPLSFKGRWVWRWKDRIDRRFIAEFSKTGDEDLGA
ncbi:FAD-dependent oxidoreductase [Marinobacterium sp. YM272]|uniref:FAD-dependent oxidoreductase n=1 Tax=Marinobacterium sp. YM272 TaxID=3421654 RepID=UPI003D7F406E